MTPKFGAGQTGFSLIEALVVIGIIGIFAAYGIPSFMQTVKNNEVSSLGSNWLRMAKIARSEAVTRKMTVSVCPASAAGSTSCSSSGADWKNGWILFTDQNNDQAITASVDEVLAVGEAFNHLKQPYLLATNSGTARTDITALSFSANGRLSIAAGSALPELIIRICDTDKKIDGLDTRINAVGVSSQKKLTAGSACNATPIL